MIINPIEAMQVMKRFAGRNAFVAAFDQKEKKEEFVRKLKEVNKSIERVQVYQVIPGQFNLPDDAYLVCCPPGNVIYWEDFYHEYYALNDSNQKHSDRLRTGYVDKAYVPALTKVRFVRVTDDEGFKVIMI